MCYHSMCDHSMWPLYVSTLCDHSMWALYVWPLYVSTLCVTTLCVHSMCEHSMWALYVTTLCARYVWSLYVWPLYVSTLCVTTLCDHSMCEHSMCEHDVCTLCVSTLCEFLGRMLQKTDKYGKSLFDFSSSAGSCSAKNVKKALSFIVKTPFKSIGEHRKVRELPRKNEHRRSWRAGNDENLQTKAVGAGRRQAETTKIHRRNEHASTKPRK